MHRKSLERIWTKQAYLRTGVRVYGLTLDTFEVFNLYVSMFRFYNKIKTLKMEKHRPKEAGYGKR